MLHVASVCNDVPGLVLVTVFMFFGPLTHGMPEVSSRVEIFQQPICFLGALRQFSMCSNSGSFMEANQPRKSTNTVVEVCYCTDRDMRVAARIIEDRRTDYCPEDVRVTDMMTLISGTDNFLHESLALTIEQILPEYLILMTNGSDQYLPELLEYRRARHREILRVRQGIGGGGSNSSCIVGLSCHQHSHAADP